MMKMLANQPIDCFGLPWFGCLSTTRTPRNGESLSRKLPSPFARASSTAWRSAVSPSLSPINKSSNSAQSLPCAIQRCRMRSCVGFVGISRVVSYLMEGGASRLILILASLIFAILPLIPSASPGLAFAYASKWSIASSLFRWER
jgi:hypothetical protein